MRGKKQKYKTIRAYKKYFLFFIVAYSLLIGNCFSQPITWQKIYNGPYPNISDYGYDICPADSGNFFIAGSVFNAQIYVLKVNSLGDTIWSKLIGTNNSIAWSVVESDSGSCVLTGQTQNLEAFTIKLDRNGNIVWHKHYGGNFVQLLQIIRTNDRGYIMCGRENFNYGVIVKTDSLGNLIWKRNYLSALWQIFVSITNFNSYSYLLTGRRSYTNQGPSYGIITRIDENGDILHDTDFFTNTSTYGRKIINQGPRFILIGETGNFKTFLVRLDTSGRIEYTNFFDSTHDEFDFADIKTISSNRYILATSRDTTNNLIFGKVMIIDSLGNSIRQKAYLSSKQVTFGGIRVLGDTGFILTGTIDNNAPTDRDIYIIKTDTLLEALPPNSVEVISGIIPDKFSLRSYPNPFNPITKIEFKVPKSSNIKLFIYDINGKEVESITIDRLFAGTYAYYWNSANYSSGVYFAVLSADKKIQKTIKLIFLK